MWNSVPTNFWNDPEKILTPGFSLRGKKRLEKVHVMVRYPEGCRPSDSDADGDSSTVGLLTKGLMKTKVPPGRLKHNGETSGKEELSCSGQKREANVFNLKIEHTNPENSRAWWCLLVKPTLKRWELEHGEFKSTLSYVVSSGPAWAT